MRNLLLTVEYPPNRGGVARYLQALVSTYPAFEVISDVSAILSPRLWPRWFKALQTLQNRRGDYDQLWVSHIHPLGLVAFASKLLWQKPYVVILHGLDFRLAIRNPWKRFLTRRILKSARLIVCNSRALSLDVRTFQFGIRKPLVIYPTLPDSLQNFSTKVMRSDHLSRKIRLLTVARLVSRKHHSAVIEAVSMLEGVMYTIVGDGSERDKLKNQIQDLGLDDRVRIRTNVSDEELGGAYAEADIFVLPVLPDKTDVEGFGIVYLEAAAAGLPIVATKMRGVNEALCAEGSIQLDNPTPEAIAEAVDRLRDSAVRERMGKANREFVKRFSRESQFGKLEPYV